MEQMPSFSQNTLESNPVEQSANYQGNWTLLQMERNKHFRDSYLALLEERISELEKDSTQDVAPEVPEQNTLSGVNLKRVKKEDNLDLLKQRLASFDDWMNDVYAKTGYVEAQEVYKSPTNLGVYSVDNEESFVFKDALVKNKEGNTEPASPRQKDMIDAHEKTHQVYGILPQKTKQKIVEPFLGHLVHYRSKNQVDEILARMAQLKNYFGFSAGEQFTREHFAYAKEHYIEDTQMDNTMKDFFEKIGNEELFVQNMNEIPC